jgi:hypothetical protein
MDDLYFDRPRHDWLEIPPRGSAQFAIRASAFETRPAYTQGLHPLSAEQLRTRKFEPPEHVLAPVLQTQGLAMIHAPRGVGKTHVSIGVACAVAAGKSFLKWCAPKPHRVLFIDGEMPGTMLQERFGRTIDALNADMPSDGLKLVAADLEPDGLPDLASEEGQQFYAEVIGPADLIIVDNLSTICRALRENEADSWGPIQSWALRLRREGKSVLFIHHAGKSGGQRGTSRKEDILNTVIALRRPHDYEASQGARFEVQYEKARCFYGEDAEPFEAWLKDGVWHIGEVTRAADDASLLALKQQGLSVREIEKRTGIPKSTVDRMLKGRGQP